MAPPPASFTVEHLGAAVRAARASASVELPSAWTPGEKDLRIRWGEQIDVAVIGGSAEGELSHEAVAGYVAMYATKFSQGMGLSRVPSAGLVWNRLRIFCGLLPTTLNQNQGVERESRPSDLAFYLEQTTGFEPATLTLANWFDLPPVALGGGDDQPPQRSRLTRGVQR